MVLGLRVLGTRDSSLQMYGSKDGNRGNMGDSRDPFHR